MRTSWPTRTIGSYDANSLLSREFDRRTTTEVARDIAMLREAISEFPRRHRRIENPLPMYLESLGISLHRLGRYDEAKKYLLRAAKADVVMERRHLSRRKYGKAAIRARFASVDYSAAKEAERARAALRRESMHWRSQIEKKRSSNDKVAADHALFQSTHTHQSLFQSTHPNQSLTDCDMSSVRNLLTQRHMGTADEAASAVDMESALPMLDEAAAKSRRLARRALNDGDVEKAITHYNTAIQQLGLVDSGERARALFKEFAKGLEVFATNGGGANARAFLVHSMLLYERAGMPSDARRVDQLAAQSGIWTENGQGSHINI